MYAGADRIDISRLPSVCVPFGEIQVAATTGETVTTYTRRWEPAVIRDASSTCRGTILARGRRIFSEFFSAICRLLSGRGRGDFDAYFRDELVGPVIGQGQWRRDPLRGDESLFDAVEGTVYIRGCQTIMVSRPRS